MKLYNIKNRGYRTEQWTDVTLFEVYDGKLNKEQRFQIKNIGYYRFVETLEALEFIIDMDFDNKKNINSYNDIYKIAQMCLKIQKRNDIINQLI